MAAGTNGIFARLLWASATLTLASACGGSAPQPQVAPQQGQAVPPPPGYYPATPTPAQPQPQPQGTVSPGPIVAPTPAPPLAAVNNDPISLVNVPYLRSQAQAIIGELVQALPAAKQQRVLGIPLLIDNTLGEVNAFAACSKSGQSAMAITDGLLKIQAVLAQAQAHDELFRTRKVDEYVSLAAQNMQPKRAVPLPGAGFFPGSADPRIVARQHQIFEEQVAFVLGHELGHHHLGHLPCTAQRSAIGAGEVARMLSNAVPLFNQPNEIASDLAGTQNVLNAGRNRASRGGYQWTEGGGILTMRFFAGFSRLSPASILTAFERSHPPPQLRTPIIQQTANTWRSTGGTGFPVLGL